MGFGEHEIKIWGNLFHETKWKLDEKVNRKYIMKNNERIS